MFDRDSPIQVEQEPMEPVLNERPDEEASDEVAAGGNATQLLTGDVRAVHHRRKPDSGNHPPRCLCQGLEEVAKERSRGTALVVARAMNLVEVEFPAEATIPNLGEQRTTEVEELVLLVVLGNIGILAEIFLAGHAGPGVDKGFLRGRAILVRCSVRRLLVNDEANEAVIQDIVGSLRMSMRGRVFQNVLDVFATVLEDKVTATRVVIDEIGNIVNLGADGNIAGLAGAV